MLNILLILLVTAVSLTVILWIGAFFFQGYIYLEPSQQLYWQAPAAAALLTFGYTIWCLWIATSPKASQTNVPIDTVMRFTPKEDMFKEPAPRIHAIRPARTKAGKERKEEESTLYVRVRSLPRGFEYQEPNLGKRHWNGTDLIAIEIENPDGSRVRFEPILVGVGDNVQYRSKDGWVMKEYGGIPTGLPERFVLGRFILNVLFNVGHWVGWFIALWLILRFQWLHALGLAIVFWSVVTLSVLPMMLTYSAYIATIRYGTTTTA